MEMQTPDLRSIEHRTGLPDYRMHLHEEDHISRMAWALRYGYVDVIERFFAQAGIDLLKNKESVRKVLLAKNSEGFVSPVAALERGHADAFRIIVRKALEHDLLDNAFLNELLGTKDRITGLYYALQNGHASSVEAITEVIARCRDVLDPNFMMSMLLSKNPKNGMPGLVVAVVGQRAAAIRALEGFVALIGPEAKGALRQLFVQEKGCSRPMLITALSRTDDKTCASVDSLLRSAGFTDETDRDILEILEQYSPSVKPGDVITFDELASQPGFDDKKAAQWMFQALKSGDVKSIEAIVALAIDRGADAATLTELLQAKSGLGFPGVAMAVNHQHLSSVEAFGRAITLVGEKVPDQVRDGLRDLFKPEASQCSMLSDALFHANDKIRGAMAMALERVGITRKTDRDIFRCLRSTKEQESIALMCKAMAGGDVKEVEAYMAQGGTDKDFLQDLALAEWSEDIGTVGANWAMSNGRTDVIEILGKWISTGVIKDEECLRKVLLAKTPKGTTGMSLMLEQGRAKTIEAVSRWVSQIDIHNDAFWEELLRAVAHDGTPGLNTALRMGHQEAMLAYGTLINEVLGRFDSKKKALLNDLMLATSPTGVPGIYHAIYNNRHEAIAAFGALCGKVGIRAEDVLRSLLNPKSDKARGLLSESMEKATEETCKALHMLLASAGITDKTDPEVFTHLSMTQP